MIRLSVQHILRPKPVKDVSDLPKGQAPKQFYVDPSVVLNKDIRDTRGNVVAHKGSRVNPLDYRAFHETLIFMNGDNPSQIRWANQFIQQAKQHHRIFKIILVSGNINSSATALHQRVYFDQHGSLCRHFHIKYTPALVFQSKTSSKHHRQLSVKEVRVD